VTTLTGHIPVDRITERARRIDPLRLLLTVLAAPLVALGWTAGKVVTVVWVVLAWSLAAVQVGWEDARSPGKAGGG
jgi:hypothetical protein